MFNAPYGYNTMPTATQPYGYSMNVGMQNYNQPQQQPQQNTSTNMIFVSGYQDVVDRYQMPNTSVMYKHNDKPIIYIKSLDNKGHFEIKEYEMLKKTHDNGTKDVPSIDLSCYAQKSDLDGIMDEIRVLKEQIAKYKQGGSTNGTTNSTIRPTITT